ncbi:hypothetical protein J7382_08520 [Shimia sp. R11_0]|uniref:hypothetical protein n=1 Tax=Shimia sp. R11_0 TaxID=2821096 RepID=UPI001ADB8710|nr:hypothetical protein [Shimia sp. R11_0]MBO9477573.1 hypothetical protein [Shimia sp. R11_0]
MSGSEIAAFHASMVPTGQASIETGGRVGVLYITEKRGMHRRSGQNQWRCRCGVCGSERTNLEGFLRTVIADGSLGCNDCTEAAAKA